MKQYLIPLIALVFCVTAVGAYIFFLNAIEERVDRIQAAAIEAAMLTKKNSALQAGDAALDETRTLRETLDTFVSTDTEVVKGITLLEQAGRRSKVDLTLGAVGVSKPESLKYHELVTIAFAAEGTFAEIIELLATLEALPHISRVDNVTIEKPGEGMWSMSAIIVYVKQKS